MAESSSFSLEGLDNMCVHYAHTLKQWRHRFNHSLDQVGGYRPRQTPAILFPMPPSCRTYTNYGLCSSPAHLVGARLMVSSPRIAMRGHIRTEAHLEHVIFFVLSVHCGKPVAGQRVRLSDGMRFDPAEL